MLRIGEVIEIFDPRTDPRKRKWHLCVCNARWLFLRINTSPLWTPNHHMTEERNAFLDHDSYVELRQLFHFSPRVVTAACRQANNPIGRMSRSEAELLARTVRRVPTLTEEQKDLIWNNLTSSDY